jgi:cell division septation protein DedD
MARDYAKQSRPAGKGAQAPKARRAEKAKPAPKPAKAAPRKESAPTRIQHGSLSLKWIASLALVGCFIGFIVYLNTLPGAGQSSDTTTNQPAPERSEPKPVPAPEPAEEEQTAREFRFYDMLPESEVATPEVNEYTPGPNMQDFDYIVQAGSFRNQQDAERLRAEIAFQGLRAQVQTVEQNNGSVWYRVNAGPFKSRSNMNSAVDKLVSIDIQPLVRKIPKEG